MKNNGINKAVFGCFSKPFPVSCSALGFLIRVESLYIQLQVETQIYSHLKGLNLRRQWK